MTLPHGTHKESMWLYHITFGTYVVSIRESSCLPGTFHFILIHRSQRLGLIKKFYRFVLYLVMRGNHGARKFSPFTSSPYTQINFSHSRILIPFPHMEFRKISPCLHPWISQIHLCPRGNLALRR